MVRRPNPRPQGKTVQDLLEILTCRSLRRPSLRSHPSTSLATGDSLAGRPVRIAYELSFVQQNRWALPFCVFLQPQWTQATCLRWEYGSAGLQWAAPRDTTLQVLQARYLTRQVTGVSFVGVPAHGCQAAPTRTDNRAGREPRTPSVECLEV